MASGYFLRLSAVLESIAAFTVESMAAAASFETATAESTAALIAVLSTVVPEESLLLAQAIKKRIQINKQDKFFIRQNLLRIIFFGRKYEPGHP